MGGEGGFVGRRNSRQLGRMVGRLGLGGCACRGGYVCGERPGTDLLVGLYGTVQGVGEGPDLAHASLCQDAGFSRERADGERESPVDRGSGDGDRSVLVDLGDVGEDEVDDLRAHGVAVLAQRRVFGEQVDDGETGLLRLANGPVDAGEVGWRLGSGWALGDAGLPVRVRRGRGGEARLQDD